MERMKYKRLGVRVKCHHHLGMREGGGNREMRR